MKQTTNPTTNTSMCIQTDLMLPDDHHWFSVSHQQVAFFLVYTICILSKIVGTTNAI